jgi:hypothetical protein
MSPVPKVSSWLKIETTPKATSKRINYLLYGMLALQVQEVDQYQVSGGSVGMVLRSHVGHLTN